MTTWRHTIRFRGVIFDLDGTLVDSWSLHVACLRAALAASGATCSSSAAIAAAQRPTDVDTVATLVGPGRLDHAWSAYQSAWRTSLPTMHSLAMPGAMSVVSALADHGLAMGICTGRSRQEAQLLLDTCGITIGLTVAREDARQPKPAPDGLLRAARAHRLEPSEVLFVGDSASDVTQGRAAGVATVLINAAGGPGRLPTGEQQLSSLDELPAYLAGG